MVEFYVTVWVFHAKVFHSFRERGNFWYRPTKYFHKVVWQPMQGVVGSLVITIVKFLENRPVKEF